VSSLSAIVAPFQIAFISHVLAGKSEY